MYAYMYAILLQRRSGLELNEQLADPYLGVT